MGTMKTNMLLLHRKELQMLEGSGERGERNGRREGEVEWTET